MVTLRSGKSTIDPIVVVPDSDPIKSDVITDLDLQSRQLKSYVPLPFPLRPVQPRKSVSKEKAREYQELVDLFSKVEVNVPLLTMIKHIPSIPSFSRICVFIRRS